MGKCSSGGGGGTGVCFLPSQCTHGRLQKDALRVVPMRFGRLFNRRAMCVRGATVANSNLGQIVGDW